MPMTREEVLSAALRLPEDDRLAIASRLMETLPDVPPGLPEDEAEFVAELDRRSGDFKDAIAWADLRDELCRNS